MQKTLPAHVPARGLYGRLTHTELANAAPADLDALVVAPANHRLVLENAFVRVLDTVIQPGDRTPLHTHRWPAVHHIQSWSAFVRRDAEGAVLLDTRVAGLTAASGAVLWGDPLGPHTLENVGSTPLHVVSIEVKAPA